MQRVKRAERLKRCRGFVYRRPCGNLSDVLKALYPGGDTRPPQDWPSAATVVVEVTVCSTEVDELTGPFWCVRPTRLLLRVPKSRSDAEARAKALAKLRLSVADAWKARVLSVKPDGVPRAEPITEILYRNSPLFAMLKTEVTNG